MSEGVELATDAFGDDDLRIAVERVKEAFGPENVEVIRDDAAEAPGFSR